MNIYIKRDIESKLLDWKKSKNRQPLILQGARQIGKTWVVNKFGKEHYKHIAVFNFDRQSELSEIFSTTKDVKTILRELKFMTGVPLIPGETLLFFDEIQECIAALNALKYFEEDAPEYHVIAAGSLLGVALNHNNQGFPVGKVHFEHMYPVTFKEFLRAYDLSLYQQLENEIGKRVELPIGIFNRLNLCYKSYFLCGGLPKAVCSFLSDEGTEQLEEIQKDILQSYISDFNKYVETKDVPRIRELWRSIPSQLSRENRKFVFRAVREGARAREYESALDWLSLSGMTHKIYLCETPLMPLSFYENTTAFKVYLLDVAILRLLSGLPKEVLISKSDAFKEFKGALAENFVLNSLIAQGIEMPHYWTLSGNKAEVDFIISNQLEVLPIEVKSDERISGKSFAVYNDKYHPSLRIRLSLRNIKQDGNLLNLPIFLADWMKKYL